MTALVLTSSDDPTANRVCRALDLRGGDHARMDLGDFPSRLSFSASGPAHRWVGWLSDGQRELRLSEITSVYYRRPTSFRFPEAVDEQHRRFAANEARQGLGGLLESLPVPFVNRPSASADAEMKPVQLQVAAKVGFQVPPTLITSSGQEARAFLAEVGDAIYKPLTSPFLYQDGGTKLVYATRVQTEDLNDEAVSLCACQFQAFVPKAFDVRLTAVGDNCFATRIRAGSDQSYVDWRADYPSLGYEPVDTPPQIAESITTYLKRFRLSMGCFDFSVGPGPDGPEMWWFLECGPNAQWGWIEHETDYPISDSIAALLIGAAQ